MSAAVRIIPAHHVLQPLDGCEARQDDVSDVQLMFATGELNSFSAGMIRTAMGWRPLRRSWPARRPACR